MSDAPSPRYTSVSLRTETRDRIRREIDRLIRATSTHRGTSQLELADQINPQCLGISVDAFITLLLDQREAHRERAERSANKKKTKAKRVEDSQ